MQFFKRQTRCFLGNGSRASTTAQTLDLGESKKVASRTTFSKCFSLIFGRILFRIILVLQAISSLKYVILSHALKNLFGVYSVVLPVCILGILNAISSLLYDLPLVIGNLGAKLKTVGKVMTCWMVVDTTATIVIMVFFNSYVRLEVLEEGSNTVPTYGREWIWAYWVAFSVVSSLGIFASAGIVLYEILTHLLILQPHYRHFGAHIFDTLCSIFLLTTNFFCVFYNFVFLCLAVYSLFVVLLGRDCPECYSFCETLDELACVLPFPSSFYLKLDPSTATGYRVNFGKNSLPYTLNEGNLDPTHYNNLDGFSILSPILFSLTGVPSIDDFASYKSIGHSIMKNSTTLLFDSKTLELIPHFVDIDIGDPKAPLIILQPARPLRHATRYIVCVRRIHDALTGDILHPNPGFLQVINNMTNERYPYFKDNIIPMLESLGCAISQVQLSWDFVTVSLNSSLSTYEKMRDNALANYDLDSANFDVLSSKTTCSAENRIGRVLTLRFNNLPWYLAKDYIGGSLPSRIKPKIQGYSPFYVMIRIPCSVLESGQPEAITQFGHGLFGSKQEIMSEWMGPFLEKNKIVMFASDWGGMSRSNIFGVVSILMARMNKFHSFVDQIWQGWTMWSIVARYLTHSPFVDHPQLLAFNNQSVFRPKRPVNLTFYGISQGGILGGGYVSSSLDVARVVLGVPGTPFALILPRSEAFSSYQKMMMLNLPNLLNLKIIISLFQVIWDAGESSGWIWCMSKELRPNTFKKSVLIQDAPGDSLLTSISAHIMARGYGAHNLQPSASTFFDDSPLHGPFVGSAITEWIYRDVPALPPGITTADVRFNTHECVKREPMAQEQVFIFLKNGTVVQTCGEKGCVKDKVCTDSIKFKV